MENKRKLLIALSAGVGVLLAGLGFYYLVLNKK